MASKDRAGIKLRLAIIGLTLIGFGLVIYTHWDHGIEEASYSPFFGGVGEAIFIAGILGLTLDRALKARLVKDVAAEALRSSWGVNSPQEYIENLSNSLASYNRITIALEVRLELTIHDAIQGIFRVKVHTRTVTQNISGRPWDTVLPSATPSAYGCPDSGIDDFELIVRNPPTGQRAPTEIRRRWDSVELGTAYERTPTGALEIKKDFDSSAWIFSVKPGGTSEVRYALIFYYRREDVVSLATSAPALSWELHVNVDEAIDNLDVRAFVGGDHLKLDGDDRGLRGVQGFTHAGATMQIVWSPRREEQAPPLEVEEQAPPPEVIESRFKRLSARLSRRA